MLGFDLHARAGDVIALCGPNGCGKSSLLGALSGLEDPIVFAGHVVWHMGGQASVWTKQCARAHAVLLRQSAGFVPTDRVRSYFELFRHSSGFSSSRLHDLCERFGVSALLDTPLALLSGGQWRRVQCAAHFATWCPVRLLDEPETGLDRSSLNALVAEIRGASARGEIVLLATHSAGLLRAVAHQVYYFDSGVCVWASNAQMFERFGPRLVI